MKRYLSIILALLIVFASPLGVYAKAPGASASDTVTIVPSTAEINIGESVTLNAKWSTSSGVKYTVWYVGDEIKSTTEIKRPKNKGSSNYTFKASETGDYTIIFQALSDQKQLICQGTAAVTVRGTDPPPMPVDTTAPTSTLDITSGTLGTGGWYTTDVGVTITAADENGGSGVKEIRYKINNGTEATLSGTDTLTISTEGTNTIEYWAVDNAGNIEVSKSETIMIDKYNPIVEVSAQNADGSEYYEGTLTSQNVTVTLNAIDANLSSFTVSGGQVTLEGTKATVLVETEGPTTISYTATDSAEKTISGSFEVDINKAPIVEISPAVDDGATYVSNQDVIVQLVASDTDLSSFVVDEVEKYSEGSTATATLDYTTDINKTITYTAADLAGNTNSGSFTVIIDTTDPAVTVTATNADGTSYTSGTQTNQDVTVTLTASDTNLSSLIVNGAEKYIGETPATATLTITANGQTEITYTAIDLAGNETTGSFVVIIQKPEPPKSTYYVALGDSIATGSSSRGTSTSYVKGFYDYLKTLDPLATYKNLSRDGDKSSDLLTHLQTEGSEIRTEVIKATVITISIGGNNVMDAARGSYFASIDTAIAESGTAAFESEYDQIIAAIRAINPTVKIIASTLYNPYNTIGISGYTGDPALQIIAELYIERINARIRNNADSNYRCVEVHDYFLNNYAVNGKMGNITYFYPWSLLKITRDPHPNQTGQNIIRDLHKAAYPAN